VRLEAGGALPYTETAVLPLKTLTHVDFFPNVVEFVFFLFGKGENKRRITGTARIVGIGVHSKLPGFAG
jgi:hypothetical protein